jgi:hypothetical protein
LVTGNIVDCRNTVDGVEVIHSTLREPELVAATDGSFNARVYIGRVSIHAHRKYGRKKGRTAPKAANGVGDVVWEYVRLIQFGTGKDGGPACVIYGRKRDVEHRHRLENGAV